MAKVISLFLSLILLQGAALSELDSSLDTIRSFKEIVENNGYTYESHTITTDDGYILSLHRIPGKAGDSGQGKQPVLLVHGNLDSADDWVANSEKLAPSFAISRAGYDVWAINSRGNYYSQKHTKYNIFDFAYWAFSFEEMGVYDIPATIDYILEKTQKKQVAYVGHSQGTTQFFAAASLMPDYYNQKVSIFLGLGPGARIDHTTSSILAFYQSQPWVLKWVRATGIRELYPHNYLQQSWFAAYCTLYPSLCSLGLGLVTDANTDTLNSDRIAVFQAHIPQGTSLQNVEHFTQVFNAKRFQRYDYGDRNIEKYGLSAPEAYDLSKIKNKVGLFVGAYDEVASPADCEWLREQLTNIVHYKEYEVGHIGLILSGEMPHLADMISLLDSVSASTLEQ